MTLTEFAGQAGIPYKTLQYLVAGKRLPSGEQLVLMAKSGVDLNWLISGKVLSSFGESIRSGDQEAIDVDELLADRDFIKQLERAAISFADGVLRRRGLLSVRETLLVLAYFRTRLARAAKSVLDNVEGSGVVPTKHRSRVVLNLAVPAVADIADGTVLEWVEKELKSQREAEVTAWRRS